MNREPYEWVTFAILGLILLAIASVIGGYVEAGNHTHLTVSHDAFGTAHRSKQNDWNYLYAGAGTAISLLLLAGVLSLLRGIAVDVRKLASR